MGIVPKINVGRSSHRLALPKALSLQSLRSIVILHFCIVTSLNGELLCAQSTPKPLQWRTARAFQKQMRAIVEMEFSATPLRRTLNTISRTQRVCCFLDRRVNPEQLVRYSSSGLPLELSLRQMAENHGLVIVILGSVVYFGPSETTTKLNALLDSNRRLISTLPHVSRARLEMRSTLSWPILAEPRAIVQGIASKYDLTIQHIDQIEHDIWDARSLPPLDFIHQISIVTAGFGLTPRLINSTTFDFIRLPDKVPVTQSTRREPPTRLDNPKKSDFEAEQRYTFNVPNQSARKMLEVLARQFRLQLVVGPNGTRLIEQRISVSVKQASRDEAIEAIVERAGLKYRIEGDKLYILKR